MTSPQAMLEYLAKQIGLLYYHLPLAYGGTAEGVETLLYAYHNAWAYLVEHEWDWRTVWWEALEAEDCGSANFATRYAMNHPDAAQEEIAAYVVAHWRPVSEKLGVPIPHAALQAEFDEWGRERLK